METTPSVDKAADYFDAHTIIDVRTDRVSKLYQPLFDEELVGVRHAEDGMLHAILNTFDGGATYEKTVGGLPFAEMVMATRPYMDGEADELL